MRTGKNARTYPTLVRVRKGFLRWEWEPVRDTIVVPPCQNVSHTVSRAETHRIELSVTGCVHQSTGGGREPLATSRLRHSRGRPKKPRPHTGTTRSHTHTLYGKHDRNPVGALRGRTTPPSLRPNPSRVLPEGFERIPQRIVCGYPCLVGLLLASYRLRQQRRYQCAYELTNKEQVITNSSPTIPA